MLNQEFKPVASAQYAQPGNSATIHALFHDHDKTLCGAVEMLDSVTMLGRVINCTVCMAELKKIRQRRSREGTARYQNRMAAERDVPPENEWAECLALSEIPTVDEAIRNHIADPCEDSAVCMVIEIRKQVLAAAKK